ncbi:MAG TPA: RNA-binding domain-containing protein [Candidatus Binatus sp.]|nr:RNA-binding domain-containing protein [Candidatus Binatus sp.]
MKNPQRLRVEAEVEVRPSEDIDKVKIALEKVVTGQIETIETGEDRYMLRLAATERASLEKLKMIIQRDKIRTAARAVFNRNTHGDKLEVFLNKQVAYVGHVSFSEREGESPLGPIRLVIFAENISAVVDWLTSGR